MNCRKILIGLQNIIPAEIFRKLRALKEVGRWKATEFRQFLLYTGPVVLHNVLPVEVYHNFLLFFVTIFCLASPSNCVSYCNYSKTLLIIFVNHFAQLDGKENVIHNVHNLIHLPEDVLKHGHFDQISGFPFENYLHKLKH